MMTFVPTPDGAIECVSAEQEHPLQTQCPETGLWLMPLIAFPALEPMQQETEC